MLNQARVPVLGFAAYSGVGKTTLLVKLLALFQAQSLRVGVIKHAHHDFDVDHPGKDSYELRKAGTGQVLVASRRRWALMVENEPPAEPRLDDLLGRLDQRVLDLVLVEGFRHEAFPKIELHRSSLGHPVLYTSDASIIAVASDAPLPVATRLPVLDLNRPEQIADFVTASMGIHSPAR